MTEYISQLALLVYLFFYATAQEIDYQKEDSCHVRYKVSSDDLPFTLRRPPTMKKCDKMIITHRFDPRNGGHLSVNVVRAAVRGYRLQFAYVDTAHAQVEMHTTSIRSCEPLPWIQYRQLETKCPVYQSPKNVTMDVHFVWSNTAQNDDQYELIVDNSEEDSCPYPILEVGSSPQFFQQITKKSDCYFRLIGPPGSKLVVWVDGPEGSFQLTGESNGWIHRNNNPSQWRTLTSEPIVDLKITASEVILRAVAIFFEPCVCTNDVVTLANEETYSVSSPGFPDFYCPQYDCSTELKAEPSNKPGYHTVFYYELEYQGYDSKDMATVSIDDQSYPYSGPSTKRGFRTQPGQVLKVNYKSQHDIAAHGFRINVTRLEMPDDCLCPSVSTKKLNAVGSFSMRVPAHCYSLTCNFNIPSDSSSSTIRIKTVYQFNSARDHIRLHADSYHIDYNFTDRLVTTRNWPVETSELTFRFERFGLKTDKTENIPDSWFNMTWQWRDDCICDDQLPMVASSEWQHFVSPDYPYHYCHDMHCRYIINAPVEHGVAIIISAFDTEPHGDWLKVFDGEELLKQFAGRKIMDDPILSKSPTMTIEFTSNQNEARQGFVINYAAIPIEKPTTTTEEPTTTSTSTTTTTTTPTSTSTTTTISSPSTTLDPTTNATNVSNGPNGTIDSMEDLSDQLSAEEKARRAMYDVNSRPLPGHLQPLVEDEYVGFRKSEISQVGILIMAVAALAFVSLVIVGFVIKKKAHLSFRNPIYVNPRVQFSADTQSVTTSLGTTTTNEM